MWLDINSPSIMGGRLLLTFALRCVEDLPHGKLYGKETISPRFRNVFVLECISHACARTKRMPSQKFADSIEGCGLYGDFACTVLCFEST